jgi:hypothetical protein
MPKFKLDLETLKLLFKTAQSSNSKVQNGGNASVRAFGCPLSVRRSFNGSKMALELPKSPQRSFLNGFGSHRPRNARNVPESGKL